MVARRQVARPRPRLDCSSRPTWAPREREDLTFALAGVIAKETQPLLDRITELERRPELRWAGTWHDGMHVKQNELLTDRGSLWLCIEATSDRPGDNASAFRLIVKNGDHSDRRRATATRTPSNVGRS